MTPLAVSLGSDEHPVSPVLSSTASFFSVRSMLSDPPGRSPGVQETFRTAESHTKGVNSFVIQQSGDRNPTRTYPEANASFVRHLKYFFQDGNVTFLIEGTLYCIHRYFFSRDSTYFSARFAQFDVHDHGASHAVISLSDTERKDFDAFLSILYPENFGEIDLSYEEWKSVLRLSTRWSFTSIRRLALTAIKPPTPLDRLLLARTYSVDDWVVPALSALCERTEPLTLSEARQMDIEDVVLVVTVREGMRSGTLQAKVAEISRHVEAAQAGIHAGCGAFAAPLSFPKRGNAVPTSSPVVQKQATKKNARDQGSKHSKGGVGKVTMQASEQPHITNVHRQGVPTMRTAKASVREAAATTTFSGAKVADARGTKLAAARHGVETAVSRAEAARTKSRSALVSPVAGNAGHEA